MCGIAGAAVNPGSRLGLSHVHAMLDTIAQVIRPAFLELLEREWPFLRDVYSASPFAKEISFEEYFIWWYHLFYSAVTDRLVAAGRIRLFESGTTSYVIIY